MNPPVYSGEINCARDSCKNRAYYESSTGGLYLCGVHSRRDVKRRSLPENPNKRQIHLAQMQEYAKLACLEKERTAPQRGNLSLRRLQMMKPLPILPGSFVVLPNAKANSHQCPGLVWACPQLSPMRLGPVDHSQPGLPPAKNIENFHQFNKVFWSELDHSVKDSKVLPVWYDRRLGGYQDVVPHRHKLGSTKTDHIKNAGNTEQLQQNANICEFSIYVNPINGEERRFSYVESRVFYCTFYEHLAKQTAEFQKLITEYLSGASLCIMGYDARTVTAKVDEITEDTLMKWYLDDSEPFGHEMVLFAMLFCWPRVEALPWNVWAKANIDFPIINMSNISL